MVPKQRPNVRPEIRCTCPPTRSKSENMTPTPPHVLSPGRFPTSSWISSPVRMPPLSGYLAPPRLISSPVTVVSDCTNESLAGDPPVPCGSLIGTTPVHVPVTSMPFGIVGDSLQAATAPARRANVRNHTHRRKYVDLTAETLPCRPFIATSIGPCAERRGPRDIRSAITHRRSGSLNLYSALQARKSPMLRTRAIVLDVAQRMLELRESFKRHWRAPSRQCDRRLTLRGGYLQNQRAWRVGQTIATASPSVNSAVPMSATSPEIVKTAGKPGRIAAERLHARR